MIRKLLSLLHNKILIVTVLILIQLFVFFGIVFKLSAVSYTHLNGTHESFHYGEYSNVYA